MKKPYNAIFLTGLEKATLIKSTNNANIFRNVMLRKCAHTIEKEHNVPVRNV